MAGWSTTPRRRSRSCRPGSPPEDTEPLRRERERLERRDEILNGERELVEAHLGRLHSKPLRVRQGLLEAVATSLPIELELGPSPARHPLEGLAQALLERRNAFRQRHAGRPGS